ncbi:MAG: glycosyltransferase family 2 protein [Clostridiales bacterium]|nr:glycosyltransferase family 2 protein [Clostridiales bacterium]
MLLSIVIPVFNEADSLLELHSALTAGIEGCYELGVSDYEIWFISDGSTDRSENVIREIIETDKNVQLISFRRNFGKATALQAGFKYAEGDIIITMDSDLQDDPLEMRDMILKLQEGYDMVSGWKQDRQDPLEKRLPSKLFNKVTATASGIKLHDFNCGFKAYRKEVVKSIDVYGELHRYIPILAHRKGFRIAEIPVTNHKRKYGKTKYGVERYLRGMFDALTTAFLSKFYDRPMHFFGRVGLALLVVGIIICVVLTVEWFMGAPISTRPLLTLGILCIILGVQSIATGFLEDLIVDATWRRRENVGHIKEVITHAGIANPAATPPASGDDASN